MSVDVCRRVGRQFFAEQDRLRGGPADDLCAADYQAQIGASGPMPLAGHQQFALMFYAAFPDLHHTIEDVIAEDRKAAVHFVLDGTHTGDFMGIPATGRSIHVNAIAILTIGDGRVTQLRAVFDQAAMLQQLGVAGV